MSTHVPVISGPPYDRTTGAGHLLVRRGDYTDALKKHRTVTLLHAESTSAFAPALDRLLRALAASARLPNAHDATRYGVARTSPHAFYPHHAAAISSAIARAETLTLHQAAVHMQERLLAPPHTPHHGGA